MTDATELAKQALELADKATPQPWEWSVYNGTHELVHPVPNAHSMNVIKLDSNQWLPTWTDAAFIAFARNNIEILARAVLEAEAVTQERDAAVAELHNNVDRNLEYRVARQQQEVYRRSWIKVKEKLVEAQKRIAELEDLRGDE